MSDKEFFTQIQMEWFAEFVDQEVREIVQGTSTQSEKFEFEDVPF